MKSGNPPGIKGKNLVEAWDKFLVTSGYTDYARNPGKPCLKSFPKLTCGISADTCVDPLNAFKEKIMDYIYIYIYIYIYRERDVFYFLVKNQKVCLLCNAFVNFCS